MFGKMQYLVLLKVCTPLGLFITILSIIVVLLLINYLKARNITSVSKEKEATILALKNKLNEAAKRQDSIEKLLEYQETEFELISKNINDQLGGLMVTALVQLQHLFEGSKDQANEPYTNLETLLKNACDEARRIAHYTMPESLFHLGIREAIEDLAQNMNPDSITINTNFLGIENLNIKKHKTWIIYQIVNELANYLSIRSDVNNVHIQFIYEGGEAIIKVKGDGHLPLLSAQKDNNEFFEKIESRVNYLGGQLKVDTNESSGNSISIKFAA